MKQSCPHSGPFSQPTGRDNFIPLKLYSVLLKHDPICWNQKYMYVWQIPKQNISSFHVRPQQNANKKSRTRDYAGNHIP